jgi:hypothetical protein
MSPLKVKVKVGGEMQAIPFSLFPSYLLLLFSVRLATRHSYFRD